MAIHNFFPKRAKGAVRNIDAYEYDKLSLPLKVQVVRIWQDVLRFVDDNQFNNIHQFPFTGYFGSFHEPGPMIIKAYAEIVEALSREIGVFRLAESENPCGQLFDFFLKSATTNQALGAIEIFFHFAKNRHSDQAFFRTVIPLVSIDSAISELNQRFKEHSVGYRFEHGMILRIDSDILHNDAVIPALTLLKNQKFHGALSEFLRAHEHLRQQAYKESLNESLKALESTLKTICKLKNWKHGSTDTAKSLIDTVFSNQLLPSYLTSHFSSLRSLLESGVPTIRNKESGHGQGLEVIDLPEYFAAFAINSCAAAIVLLINAYLDASVSNPKPVAKVGLSRVIR